MICGLHSIACNCRGGVRVKLLWSLLGVVLVISLTLGCLLLVAHPKSPIQVALADGRILQIEGVTYGTRHRIGNKSMIAERLGPWLPWRLRAFVQPKVPEASIELDRAALVVWVNAIDPVTGTNIDCQGIRTEFVNSSGDLFEVAA